MRDGLLGLILFISHWLSPETGTARIGVEFLKDETQSYQFLCNLILPEPATEQLSAGILWDSISFVFQTSLIPSV